MKIYFLTLIIFAYSISSQASDCSTVELDKNSASMSGVPVLNQGQTSTCYAHTGTVMLEAFMQSQKGEKGFVANPILAALLTNPDLVSGGLNNFSCDAINQLTKYGNCNLKSKVHFSQLLKKLETFYVSPGNSGLNEGIKIASLETQMNAQGLMCYLQDVVPGIIDGVNLNDFVNILNQANKTYYIQDIVKAICKDDLKKFSNPPKCIGERRVVHGGERKSNEYRDKMHKLLDKPDAQPIGVGYCGKVLMDGKNYVGYKAGFLGFTSVSALAECGLHESVVIGRKKIGDKCFFKIRNSWGNYFHSHPDWLNKNDGNVWVEENALTNNMGSLSYLE